MNFFGDEERKEVNDVLETGILMRYGFDGARNGKMEIEGTGTGHHRDLQMRPCPTGCATVPLP